MLLPACIRPQSLIWPNRYDDGYLEIFIQREQFRHMRKSLHLLSYTKETYTAWTIRYGLQYTVQPVHKEKREKGK